MANHSRTHRERKEQYIRALEVEISRLREGYSNDITAANLSILQHRQALEEQQDENKKLKEILASNGINVDSELERHKSTSASHGSSYAEGTAQSHSQPQSSGFSGSGNYLGTTPDTTVSSGRTPPDMGSALPDMSQQVAPMQPYPGSGTHASHYHGQSGKVDEVGFFGGEMGESAVVGEMPGIFEKDPQLGIDFVLAYEYSLPIP